jgi:1,4-alpha-glucan branching enzyme
MLALHLAPAALVRPRETPEITPAASSFTVAPADGHYMVRVRLPRARTVELSGDFNGWQPLRLTREVDGSWVIMLDLKPGAHRMNLRVDGERWLPPPGSTAVDDEFNGKVGLVVVR